MSGSKPLPGEWFRILTDNGTQGYCFSYSLNVFEADENGKPIEITKRYSGIGEHMIEDFMIMANETVASHMFYMDLPAVYRVHGDPSEERLRKYYEDGRVDINSKIDEGTQITISFSI